MDGNTILANVAGKAITAEDVELAIEGMGQRAQNYRTPQGRAMILEQLINQRLLIADATRNLYEREPAFKELLARAKEELLVHYSMSKIMEKVTVNDVELRKYYEDNKSKFEGKYAFNASHILVDKEEDAKAILAKIRAGEISFADAARQSSKCPSSAEGGSLGDFASGQMVPDFEKVCVEMEVGAISEPVRTQFGWHLIQLHSRSDAQTVPYEEVKEELREHLLAEKQQAAYQSKINQLKILFPVDRG